MISVIEYFEINYYYNYNLLLFLIIKILCNSRVLDINQIDYNKLVSSFKAIKL